MFLDFLSTTLSLPVSLCRFGDAGAGSVALASTVRYLPTRHYHAPLAVSAEVCANTNARHRQKSNSVRANGQGNHFYLLDKTVITQVLFRYLHYILSINSNAGIECL